MPPKRNTDLKCHFSAFPPSFSNMLFTVYESSTVKLMPKMTHDLTEQSTKNTKEKKIKGTVKPVLSSLSKQK